MKRLLTILSLLLLTPILATGEASQPPYRDINEASLTAFFDTAFTVQKFDHELAGALVVVVKDNRVVFQKGYGYADLSTRQVVDPEKHLFRIASISKPFTWTAVMQLVEAGKLDLDADIQTYLDFEIPGTFKQPIRLRDLMTHSPGFEERGSGGFAHTADKVMPLQEYLQNMMPARARPPGEYGAYSNYGTALAGYIVEKVSGKPWADYIQQEILDPLGLNHTNVHQPMSETFVAAHAKGYSWQGGRWIEEPYWYEHEAPAGIISATAPDMARWMRFHLNGGDLDGVTIMQPETVASMQTPLFQQHPDADPVLHGFYRSDRNGQIIFGHGGDVNQFHSNMALYPQHDLGVFVSYNSDPGAGARSNIVLAFTEHFFPVALATPLAANKEVDLEPYAGQYASTRRNYSTFERLGVLVNSMQLSPSSDHELVMASPGNVSRWIPEKKDQFRGKYSERRMLFHRDSKDQVTHISFDHGFGSYEKVAWYESSTLHITLFVASALAALLYLSIFLWRQLRRLPTSLPFIDRWAAVVLSGFSLFLLLRVTQGLTGDTSEFLYGVPTNIEIAFATALICLPLTIMTLLFATWHWVMGEVPLLERVAYSAFSIIMLLFMLQLWFWNILTYFFQ